MPSAEESICCKEVQATQFHMQETDVNCVTKLEAFRVHLHPSILETVFKMNKKNWKKNNTPKEPGRKLSNK